MTVKVSNDNFQKEVLESAEPVLVDFWADWCAPCKMVAPVLEEISTEYEGKLKVAKVDVDTNAPLAEKYKIVSIPSLVLFKNGEVAEKKVGALPKDMILSFLSSHL